MIICIFIIAHLLLDFTFQSSDLAEKKTTSFKHLLLHCLIYLIGFAVVCTPLLTVKYSVLTIIILSLSHFIIDWSRQKLESLFNNNLFKFISFIVDQIIHISIIIAVFKLLNLNTHVSLIYSLISKHAFFNDTVLYALLFISIWDPASIFIKKLFEFMLSNSLPTDEKDLKMGNLIGKLERLIVSVLVLSNQYGVVGLVLTAKSIARFKQLEDKNFAEKYLVGTLTSISLTLIASIIIKTFLA